MTGAARSKLTPLSNLGLTRPEGSKIKSDLRWVLFPIPVLNSGGLLFLHRLFELEG